MDLQFIWTSGWNLFGLFWLAFTTSLLAVGLAVHFYEPLLPTFFVEAFKFGKLNSPSLLPGALGRLLSILQVPKRSFKHFYLVALVLHLVFLVGRIFWPSQFIVGVLDPILRAAFGRSFDIPISDQLHSTEPLHSRLLALLILFQIARRAYESHFVSIYSASAKINILQYLSGHAFYLSVILAYWKVSLGHSSHPAAAAVATDTTSHGSCESCLLKTAAAVLVFGWSSLVQFQAHYILATLRTHPDAYHRYDSTNRPLSGPNRRGRDDDGGGGDPLAKDPNPEYALPHGSLFDLVSCPHYFAEILIYSSLASLGGWDTASWAPLAYWVLTNQTLAALMTHKWYQDHFGRQMPPDRRALVPYLF